MVASKEITGGDLMSYLISVQNAQKSLASVGVIFANSLKAFSSFNRCLEYIKIPVTIPIEGGITPNNISGKVEFRNVQFAYPSRPDQTVLNNFKINLDEGKVVAFCGGSGVGKSTIGALLERFYDPLSGEIYLDGVDIKDIDPQWLRKNIGYINQEPVLFATSILENIKYGKPDASMEEVFEACR